MFRDITNKAIHLMWVEGDTKGWQLELELELFVLMFSSDVPCRILL